MPNDAKHIIILAQFSLYVSNNYRPVLEPVPYMGNIRLADVYSIMAMKMEVMLRRMKMRDYYDIYSILREGYDISKGIEAALKYSQHKLSTKNLVMMLLSDNFLSDENFEKSRRITDDLERKYGLHPKGERQGAAWQLAPIDPTAGNLKKQVAGVVKSLSATYKLHSLSSYRALLSLYGVGVEKVEGDNKGHRYTGLVYSALDADGNRIGRPLKSSLFDDAAGGLLSIFTPDPGGQTDDDSPPIRKRPKKKKRQYGRQV